METFNTTSSPGAMFYWGIFHHFTEIARPFMPDSMAVMMQVTSIALCFNGLPHPVKKLLHNTHLIKPVLSSFPNTRKLDSTANLATKMAVLDAGGPQNLAMKSYSCRASLRMKYLSCLLWESFS